MSRDGLPLSRIQSVLRDPKIPIIKDRRVVSLALATPSKGEVHDRLQDQLINLFQACAYSVVGESIVIPGGEKIGVSYCTRQMAYGSSIAHLRNILLQTGLRTRLGNDENTPLLDWQLMCDSDNFHLHGGDIVRMIIDGERYGAAVIAAPVARRDGICNFQVKKSEYVERRGFAPYAGKLTKCDRVGTAFMAINLRWIRRVWPTGPWFQFHTFPNPELPGELTWVGEDYWFCDGVTSRGGDIYLDGRYEPRHKGVFYPDTRSDRMAVNPIRYRALDEVPEEKAEGAVG